MGVSRAKLHAAKIAKENKGKDKSSSDEKSEDNLKKQKSNSFPSPSENKQKRPTIFCDELVDRICETIANTPKSIENIVAENPWMPARQTINRWQLTNASFRAKYIQAKQAQVVEHINYNLQIADEIDWGDPRTAMAEVQKAKLRIEARQWYASKIAPRIYGDKPEDDNKKEEDLSESERLAKIQSILDGAKTKS